MFIKKLHDKNEELKGSTIQLKLQDEKLQNLRQKVEIEDTKKRRWTKEFFFHKKQ